MPFDNPYFATTFDVGDPLAGHMHFDANGTEWYGPDGVTPNLTYDTATGDLTLTGTITLAPGATIPGSAIAGAVANATDATHVPAAGVTAGTFVGGVLLPTANLSGQITTTQITNLAVTTPLLAANAVTAAKIAANTITAAQIAANTITSNEIAANTITTGDLSATAINGMTIIGAVIKTASSGTFWEMSGGITDKLVGNLSGNVQTGGMYLVPVSGVTQGELQLFAPVFNTGNINTDIRMAAKAAGGTAGWCDIVVDAGTVFQATGATDLYIGPQTSPGCYIHMNTVTGQMDLYATAAGTGTATVHATNFDLSNCDVLLGGWTAYTPAVTGLTGGAASGQWRLIADGIIAVEVAITAGTITTAGTGPSVSLPPGYTADAFMNQPVPGRFNNNVPQFAQAGGTVISISPTNMAGVNYAAGQSYANVRVGGVIFAN